MNVTELTERPRLASKAMLRHDEVRDAELLLLPERVVRLSDSSAAVLRLCDGARTVGELLGRLREDYPSSDLTDDVLGFLDDARQRGWVVVA